MQLTAKAPSANLEMRFLRFRLKLGRDAGGRPLKRHRWADNTDYTMATKMLINQSTPEVRIFKPRIENKISSIVVITIFTTVVIMILSRLFSPQIYPPNDTWINIVILCILLLGIAIQMHSLIFTHIEVSESGIKYCELGCEINASWKNIMGIEKYYKTIYLKEDLIISEPKISAPLWMKPYLIFTDSTHRIPLRRFDINWRNHELGKYILNHIDNRYI